VNVPISWPWFELIKLGEQTTGVIQATGLSVDERERRDRQRIGIDELAELLFEFCKPQLLASIATNPVGDRHLDEEQVVAVRQLDCVLAELLGMLVLAERRSV
jgi:hypothetical protein